MSCHGEWNGVGAPLCPTCNAALVRFPVDPERAANAKVVQLENTIVELRALVEWLVSK